MRAAICLGLAGVLLSIASGALAEEVAGKGAGACRPRSSPKRGLDLREPCPEPPASGAPVPTGDANSPPASARPAAVVSDVAAAAPRRDQHWYGDETLLADGIALGAMTVGIAMVGWDNSNASESGGVVVFLGGVGTYLLAAPIIHSTHDGFPPFASLGLRVGLPIVGALIGANTAECGSDDLGLCGAGYAALGVFVGMAAAVVVDAALAWEPDTTAKSGIRLTPLIALERGRSYFGATGTF